MRKLIVCVACAACVALTACRHKDEAESAPVVTVDVAPVLLSRILAFRSQHGVCGTSVLLEPIRRPGQVTNASLAACQSRLIAPWVRGGEAQVATGGEELMVTADHHDLAVGEGGQRHDRLQQPVHGAAARRLRRGLERPGPGVLPAGHQQLHHARPERPEGRQVHLLLQRRRPPGRGDGGHPQRQVRSPIEGTLTVT